MDILLLPLLVFIFFGYSESRVEIRTTKVGDDKTIPREGDTVSVHYTGRLTDSRIFDTSRGRSPFDFVVGQGSVINGWDVMVRYMSKGQKARVIITYDDAYGDTGIAQSNPPIPPFATLIFDVEIVDVKRAAVQNQGNSVVQNNIATNQQLQGKAQTGQNAMSGQIAGQVGQSTLNFPAQVTGMIGQTSAAGGLATASGIQTGMVGTLPGTQFGAQQLNPLATQQQAQQFNQANLLQQLNAAATAGVQQQPQQQFVAQPGTQTFNALNALQTQQQLLAAQMPQQQFASQTVMQQQPRAQFAQAAGIQQQPAVGSSQPRNIGLPAVNTNFVSPVGQSGLGVAAGNSQLMATSG